MAIRDGGLRMAISTFTQLLRSFLYRSCLLPFCLEANSRWYMR